MELEEVGEVGAYQLAFAWMRRKQVEAKLMAGALLFSNKTEVPAETFMNFVRGA